MGELYDLVMVAFRVMEQFGLIILTGVGAIWIAISGILSRFGLAMLLGLGRAAGTGLGARFTGSTQMASRRMPTNPTGRHARQALMNAEARQQRMRNYVTAWSDLLAARGGPFAVSVHLHSLLNSGFREKVARLRERCGAFDRLEARAQRAVQRYERDYDLRCQPIRLEILALNVELARWKARNARFAFQIWKTRWRHNARNQRRIRKQLIKQRWQLFQAERELSLSYGAQVAPALVAVDQYERNFLMHWVHSFEADLESFKLTVMTGRLIDLILAPQAARLRDELGLGALPATREALGPFLTGALDDAGVAYGPEERLETLFEAYLRMLLRDPAIAQRWGINPIWLGQTLPAPGAFGVASDRYHHLERTGGWQRPKGSASLRTLRRKGERSAARAAPDQA